MEGRVERDLPDACSTLLLWIMSVLGFTFTLLFLYYAIKFYTKWSLEYCCSKFSGFYFISLISFVHFQIFA